MLVCARSVMTDEGDRAEKLRSADTRRNYLNCRAEDEGI